MCHRSVLASGMLESRAFWQTFRLRGRHRESDMISIAWKFIAVIGVAGVIALAVTPADARSARSARSTVSNQAFYNVPQSFRRSFGYAGRSGVNVRDGRNGANWNRNQ